MSSPVHALLQDPVYEAFVQDVSGAENLKAAFEYADLNGDGQMDVNEFAALLEEYGIDFGPAEELFIALDADGSGGVDYHEMVSVFILVAPYESITMAGISESSLRPRLPPIFQTRLFRVLLLSSL
jgi:hypothetical protein